MTGKSFRQHERSGARPVSMLETWLTDQSVPDWKAVYRGEGRRPSLLSTWSRGDDSFLRTLDVDLYLYCGKCQDMIIAFEIKDSHESDQYWTRTRNYAKKLGSWSALAVEYRERDVVVITSCTPEGHIFAPKTYSRQEYLEALDYLKDQHACR